VIDIGTTTNYGFKTYSTAEISDEYLDTYIANVSGNGANSNISKIDIAIKNVADAAPLKSVTATATLSAASWGSTSPYTYTYNNANILNSSHPIELLPGDSITSAQLEALQKANIVGGTQSTGQIILKAFGEKPTIDIPVRFIFRRDI